jgi:hypothetical protein
MIPQAELDRFFEQLVATVQATGGVCAITSGMACVQYGVAQATQDCDLLCAADSAGQLLNVLRATPLHGVGCSYRGHLTPPLDRRWLRGGWISHFDWDRGEVAAYLDVFGVAPRASSAWPTEGAGILTGMHTVAEMKRTDRAKDWPCATALGVKLLEDGDPRGWLHIFDVITLREVFARVPLPDAQVAQRPCLALLRDDDPRLELAVFGETVFWQMLDRLRTQVYQRALRKYFTAVKKDPQADSPDLDRQHEVRVRHAEQLLPTSPLRDYGLERLVAEARSKAGALVAAGALDWLPDASLHFVGLE